ncbi:WD40 repeat domain-containing protein [Actinoplanes sp. NPDC051470]|uniref:WD40 repeat domain-containing protein n=1 Tax=Actinoplanes sp. NPDC051470 TaxID=3157224 RepID=UPI00343EAADD
MLSAGTGALLGTAVGLLMVVASLACFAIGGGGAGSGLWASALVGFLFFVLIVTRWSLESAPPGRLPARLFSVAAFREAFAVAPTPSVLMWIPLALGSGVATMAIDGWSISSGELFLGSMGLALALLVTLTFALVAYRWLLAVPAAARLDSPREVVRQDRTSALVSAVVSGLVFALLLMPLGLTTAVLGSAVYGWSTGGAGWLQNASLTEIAGARLVDVVPGYFSTWAIVVWLLVVVPGLLVGTYLLLSRAWFRFQIARLVLAGTRVLPLRMLGLLEDACRRKLLRQSGGAYQFRHLRLQERLADDQSAAYRAELETARRRARRRHRILVPALIGAFLASLVIPLAVVPRDDADKVLRLPYGRLAESLVISPDGETLATSSADGVRLWRLDQAGDEDHEPYFVGTAGDNVRPYFNPSGQLFFVRDEVSLSPGPDADAEPRVRVWRWAARGWEQLGAAWPPESVVLLDNGAKVGLLSAGDGRANATLNVYSADSESALSIPGRFAVDLGDADPPEYDADGAPMDLVGRRFVLSGSHDGSLTVWDTAGDPPSRRTIAQPGGGPNEAMVDPAGKRVVVRTKNGAKLFDLASGTSVTLPFRETKSELRFDPTGTWLAGSSGNRENDDGDDFTVTVWNAADSRQRRSWPLGGDVVDFDFVPGAPTLLVKTAEPESDYSTLQLLPVNGGPASPPVTGATGYSLYQTRPKPILVVPRFRSGPSGGQQVDILDATSGSTNHTIAFSGDLEQADGWTPGSGADEGQPPPIVATTANGRMAWNAVTGQKLGPDGRVDWVDHLENPLGTVIAGRSDRGLAVYDARTGVLIRRLVRSVPPPSPSEDDTNTDFGPIGALFSADGRFLATPAAHDAIQVWDLADGDAIELKGHSGRLATFVWGCGKTWDTLISAGMADSTVRLWRL